MKLELNFEDLESQWKVRQLDLFPWMDGLFSLLRSREAIIQETKKRLSSSTPATMVQFLSSDDRDNARVARQTIKEQALPTILPILLYSLEKIGKKDYPYRVMESLFDFDPAISFGYLLGYLNIHQEQKSKLFQVIRELFSNLMEFFPSSHGEAQFLCQLLLALGSDLKERMPSSGKLKTWEDFEAISPDLEVMLFIFNHTKSREMAGVVEKEMKKLGREVLKSLHGLPLEFGKGDILFKQLLEIIPYMALLRIEADRLFLQHLPVKIKYLDLSQDQKEEIIQKAEAAIMIIDQSEVTINEILDKLEISLFYH